MFNRRIRKLLAVLLAFFVAFSSFPLTAYADEGNGNYISPTPGSPAEGLGVAPGAALAYDFHYKNNGTGTEDVTITVKVPDTLEVDASTSKPYEYDEANRTVTWVRESILPDGTGWVTLQVHVKDNAKNPDGTTTNTITVGEEASIKFSDGTEYSSDTIGTISHKVPQDPKKSVGHPGYSSVNGDGEGVFLGRSADGGSGVKPGEPGNEAMVYKVSWYNYTGETTSLTIHDQLNEHQEYVGLAGWPASAGYNKCTVNGANVDPSVQPVAGATDLEFKIDNIPANAVVEVSFQVKVKDDTSAGDVMDNTAELSFENDIYKANTNTTHNVIPAPQKVETYPGNDEPVAVGEKIVYKLTATNYKDKETTLKIFDLYDKHLKFVSATDGGVDSTYPDLGNANEYEHQNGHGVIDFITFGDPCVIWEFTDVPAGVTKEVTVTFEVVDDTADPLKPGETKIKNKGRAEVEGDNVIATDNVENPVVYKRSIEGIVWHDVDGDGTKEGGDEVKSGVTVNLLDADGNPVLDEEGNPITATTDENGKYHFDVPSNAGDNFSIQIDTDSEMTKQSPSSDGTKSIANADGIISNITLPDVDTLKEDSLLPNQDAGVTEYTRKISGNTWMDPNKDGTRETSDKFVPGVTVKLLDSNGAPILDKDGNPLEVTTDANGHYEFDLSNLSSDDPNGNYQIVFDTPLTATKKGTNSLGDPTVPGGAIIGSAHVDTAAQMREKGTNQAELKNQDQGFIPVKRAIEGIFWHDADGDGVKEDGDKVISGVKVNLLDKDGKPVTDEDGKPITAETDENGKYHFDVPVDAGDDFQIEFVTNEEFTKQSGKSEGNASIADPETGKITKVELPSIETLTEDYLLPNQDAGVTEYKRELSGFTWLDPDNDGTRESDENVMIPGVTVRLLDQKGNPITDADGKALETVTDEDGYYEFDLSKLKNDDENGDYQIVFEYEDLDATKKSDTASSDETMTSMGDKVDEDTEAGTKKGAKIAKAHVDTVDEMREDGTNEAKTPHQDQGFTVKRSIEGIFWHDKNGDGVKDDDDDKVIKGVTVKLLDAEGKPVKDEAGDPITAVTDDNGKYHFDVPAAAGDKFQIEFVTDEEFTKQSEKSDADASIADPDARKITKVELPSVKSLTEDYLLPNQDAGVTEYKRVLSGYTWLDPDDDGTREDDDKSLAGVIVTLLDQEGNPITDKDGNPLEKVTDENGYYEFDLSKLENDDPDGDYQVVFEVPRQATEKGENSLADPTEKSESGAFTGSVIEKAHVETPNEMRKQSKNETSTEHQDAGFVTFKRSISGITWVDKNGNGTKDPEDTILTGVKVRLLDENGDPVLDEDGNEITAVTDENGKYVLEVPESVGDPDAVTNTFKVEVLVDTFEPTQKSESSDGDKSLIDPTGLISGVELPSLKTMGEEGIAEFENPNNDAGYKAAKKKVGGVAWKDSNGDGVYNPGEKVMPEVPVSIYRVDEKGNPVPGSEKTTVTDKNGRYSFDLVDGGDYVIVFDVDLEKEGLEVTKNGTGPNGSKSDKKQTIKVTVPTDQEILDSGESEWSDLTLNSGYKDAEKVPDTSDANHVTEYLIMGMMSLIVLAGTVLFRKRYQN